MLVSELIKELKALPQDRSVVCQVVGADAGAWNMRYELKNIEQSDWIVQLKVYHPDLKDLPMGDELFERERPQDGFLVGSTWIDDDTGQTVQIVDGQGVSGMPEVKTDDGVTYYASPITLQPYEA